MFNLFWKDPVWSKVVSVAIIGFVSYLYSLIESNPIFSIFEKSMMISISSYLIILLCIIGLIILIIFLNRLKQKKADKAFLSLKIKYSSYKLFQELFKNNYQLSDTQIKLHGHLPQYLFLITELKKDKMIDIKTTTNLSLNALGKKIFDSVNI